MKDFMEFEPNLVDNLNIKMFPPLTQTHLHKKVPF